MLINMETGPCHIKMEKTSYKTACIYNFFKKIKIKKTARQKRREKDMDVETPKHEQILSWIMRL